MMIKLCLFFFILCCIICENYSILEWSDEFDNTILDPKKWEIDNEISHCEGEYKMILLTLMN